MKTTLYEVVYFEYEDQEMKNLVMVYNTSLGLYRREDQAQHVLQEQAEFCGIPMEYADKFEGWDEDGTLYCTGHIEEITVEM